MRFTSVAFRNTTEYARWLYTRIIIVSSKFHDLQNVYTHPNRLPLMQRTDTDMS